MKKALLCGGYDPKACAGCSCDGTPPCFEWTDEYPPIEKKNTIIERELEVVYDPIPPELVVAMTIWGEARNESIKDKVAVADKINDMADRFHLATGYPGLMCLSSVCRANFSCWNDGQFVRQQPDQSDEWEICARMARLIVSISVFCEFDK
jgi:hypothetical protein